MAKTLRTTDNPQFTNKNAELTNSELDENFIALQEEINIANGLSQIPTYSSGTEYRKDRFVSYGYVIYRFISDIPQSGVEPGTNESVWSVSSLAEWLTMINYIVATKDEIDALVAAGELQVGRYYYALYPSIYLAWGIAIIALAATNKTFCRMGNILVANPDHQNNGDYSSVESFSAQLGLWKSSRGTMDYLGGGFSVGETITGGTSGATAVVVIDTPYASPASPAGGTLSIKDIVGTFLNGEDIEVTGSPAVAGIVDGTVTYTFNPQTGDVVIWDNKHYRKKTDTVTSSYPNADGTNYEFLNYDETNGYIYVIDTIVGDWDNFSQIKRIDQRGNEVGNPLGFQWGRDTTKNNIIPRGITVEMRNFYGTMEDCIFQGTGTFDFDESEANYEGVIFTGGSTEVGDSDLEKGEFSISADGSSGTINGSPAGSALVDNGGGFFTITIPTAKKVKFIHDIMGYKNGSISIYSFGKGDDSGQNCQYNDGGSNAIYIDKMIAVLDASADGWLGVISDIRNTEIDFTLELVGSGVEMICQWFAETKQSI